MTQLSISQARTRLTRLARQLKKDHEAVEGTNRGVPVLAILPWDLYEGLEETIEILEDEKLTARLREAMKDVRQGKLISLENARKALGL